MYNKQWTEFEVQSIAYGILRKNLYPEYLVRGEYIFPATEAQRGLRADIAIFKAGVEPELVCIVEVKKSETTHSTRQGERYTKRTGVPTVYVRGGSQAFKVMDLVKPVLDGTDRDQSTFKQA